MIKYIEKTSGMHEAIAKIGLSLREENGVWETYHDEKLVQAFIDSYSVSDAAEYVCSKIDGRATELRNKFTKGVSPAEMAIWGPKYTQALAFKNNSDGLSAKILSAEATKRNVSIDELADKVIANFNVSADLEASIAGIAGKHKDAVRSLSTFKEINSYDFSVGWPE